MTGWGKEWLNVGDPNWDTQGGKLPDKEWPVKVPVWPLSQKVEAEIDLAKPNSDKSDLLGWDTSSNAAVYAKNLKSQGSNLVDAEAYLYFQCESCQTILDPHTRSFARLQQVRVDKGWKCVWNTNGLGYNVYCSKCEDGK